jgi:hypothetical protein
MGIGSKSGTHTLVRFDTSNIETLVGDRAALYSQHAPPPSAEASHLANLASASSYIGRELLLDGGFAPHNMSIEKTNNVYRQCLPMHGTAIDPLPTLAKVAIRIELTLVVELRAE